MPKVLDPFRFGLIAVAGWMNHRQLQMIEYLREENRILREQLGERRLRLTDDQRRLWFPGTSIRLTEWELTFLHPLSPTRAFAVLFCALMACRPQKDFSLSAYGNYGRVGNYGNPGNHGNIGIVFPDTVMSRLLG